MGSENTPLRALLWRPHHSRICASRPDHVRDDCAKVPAAQRGQARRNNLGARLLVGQRGGWRPVGVPRAIKVDEDLTQVAEIKNRSAKCRPLWSRLSQESMPARCRVPARFSATAWRFRHVVAQVRHAWRYRECSLLVRTACLTESETKVGYNCINVKGRQQAA